MGHSFNLGTSLVDAAIYLHVGNGLVGERSTVNGELFYGVAHDA